MNKREKQIKKDELFKIYVKCYKEMCEEIDELTKPYRFECEEVVEFEYCESGDEMHDVQIEYCERCDCLYNRDTRDLHNNSKTHFTPLIEDNKYLLELRVFNYMNKLKSNI